MRVSVVGGGTVTETESKTAEAVGRLIGDRDHTLVCGGLGGVMKAACRGAWSAGGRTIGIVPSDDSRNANEFVDVAVATGLGHARNALVVMNGDAVIAVAGGGGTLSELGFSIVFDRPVAGLGTHDVPGVTAVKSPEAAVEYVEDAV